MTGERSLAEVEHILRNNESGETPRIEVRGGGTFNYTHGIAQDFLESDGPSKLDQPLFAPEMYEEDDLDLIEGEYAQGRQSTSSARTTNTSSDYSTTAKKKL